MSRSNTQNYSEFLLKLTNILIFGGIIIGILSIGSEFVILAAWGRNSIWLVANIMKVPLILSCYSFLSVVGQTDKKRFGFLTGMSLALSIGLIGILGTSLDLIKGLKINSEDLIILIAFIAGGVGLFFWTRHHFLKKHSVKSMDFLTLILLTIPVVVFYLIDWYFLLW